MQQDTTYKYLSIVLGIVALIFAVLYFSKPEPTVDDLYKSVTSKVKTCNDNLIAWKKMYPATTTSPEKQNALETIINDCQNEVEEGQNQLR